MQENPLNHQEHIVTTYMQTLILITCNNNHYQAIYECSRVKTIEISNLCAKEGETKHTREMGLPLCAECEGERGGSLAAASFLSFLVISKT